MPCRRCLSTLIVFAINDLQSSESNYALVCQKKPETLACRGILASVLSSAGIHERHHCREDVADERTTRTSGANVPQLKSFGGLE